MSKLYDKYSILKKKDSSKFYLFQSGIFYIFIDEDAIFMSSALNLKLTHLNNTIVKCGFPVQNIDKYFSIFKTLGFDVEIVSNDFSNNSNYNNSISNDRIIKFLETLSSIDVNTFSVRDAYEYLEKLKDGASCLLSSLK